MSLVDQVGMRWVGLPKFLLRSLLALRFARMLHLFHPLLFPFEKIPLLDFWLSFGLVDHLDLSFLGKFLFEF